MNPFGFSFDRAVLDEPHAFDAMAAPFFRAAAAGGGRRGLPRAARHRGTPANVRLVAEALAARGCGVYAPLLPGHGRTVRALAASTGDQWLRCAREGYDRLRAAGCGRIVPVGLSLGGILAGLLASERPVRGARAHQRAGAQL